MSRFAHRAFFATHILPQTIAGQISSLVIVSMVLICALTVGIIQFMHSEPSPRLAETIGPLRIGTLVQLASAARSPAEIDDLVAMAQRAGIDVTKASAAALAARSTKAVPGRTGATLNKLGAGHGIVGLADATLVGGSVLVRLGDDNGLVFRLPPEIGVLQLLTIPVTFTLAVAAVFVIVLTIYAARWITAPLSSFAAVARSFGGSAGDDQVLREGGPREIFQVAQALNDMRTRIRTIVESRTRMLAAIGHDLRTPLTRLRLYAERLDAVALQDSMIREITTIDNMLGETLTYLRDDAHTEPTLSIDLPSLLQTICSEFADLGHQVSYRGPDKIAYACRPNALRRALTNLVENAVKHGTEVTVSLRVLHDVDDDALRIEVADDGPGIPLALREKAFEPFFKGDAARTTSKRAGFGLGLSIARDVIADHRGDIRLGDRMPRGLSVEITLPVAETEQRSFAADLRDNAVQGATIASGLPRWRFTISLLRAPR